MRDVQAAIAQMREQHAQGVPLCNPLYGLLCDETDYMEGYDVAVAIETTRIVCDFLSEIKYPGMGVEAREVFPALFRSCDVAILVAIGQEFGADTELWQDTIEQVLSECIAGDFAFDAETYEKLVELCTTVGVPALDWKDNRVCGAIMTQARYDAHCGGIQTGSESFSSWCAACDTSLIEFAKVAGPACAQIATNNDNVEPAAVAYADDLATRGITREQMLAELKAHGIYDNKLIGLKALEAYAYNVKQAHSENLSDPDEFVRFVRIMSLFEPGFLKTEIVQDAAQWLLDDGMTVEYVEEKLAPYELSLQILAKGF